MKTEGYFLIECICYVVLSMLIVFFLMRTVVATMITLKKSCSTHSALCQIFAAHNLLEHDLQEAPSPITSWKLISDTALIWKSNEIDRGWLFEKQTLSRIHGTYNSAENRWIKKTKHTVARNLDSVVFKPKKGDNQQIDIVGYAITSKATKTVIEHTVMIHKRVV